MLQSANGTTANDTFFHSELERLAPTSQNGTPCSLAEAEAYCQMWAKRQYENFTVVSFLLPKKLRQDFFNVYAYCRWSDNLADEVSSTEKSIELLESWKRELLGIFSGVAPQHPILIALQSTIKKYDLASEPLTDLLDAFKQDQQTFRYDDSASLLNYCKRSADPVGRILLKLTSSYDDTNVALSDAICTGLQLANFCQDMSRDAAIDRIYCPKSLWQKHGVTESMILSREVTDELRSMLRTWVDSTKEYFDRGAPLIDNVPRWFARDLSLFVGGGRAILGKIEKADFDVWTHRPTVSKFQKMKLLLRSLWTV